MKIFTSTGIAFLILVSSLFFISFQEKNSLSEQILSFFQKIQEEYPLEKAYLHLDKNIYTLGEDIWFSAYVVAGGTQIPSPLSGTLYVDLFNGEGLLLTQKKIRLDNGNGKGDLQLPPFGEEGIYRIKAYTSWMENFGKEYVFEKEINVFNGSSTSFFPILEFTEMKVENGKVKYQVSMEATDKEGQILKNEIVNVTAFGEGQELYTQQLQLNEKGKISFSFTIPEKPFVSQWLDIMYLENDDYPVSKKLKLPYSLSLADIQFMPEGGNLVANSTSQVAFKGIYPDGSPVDITGEIVGSDVSIPLKTLFGGMGKFELTPLANTNYKAIVKDPAFGTEKSIDLPKIEDKGLVIQVINNPSLSYITALVQGDVGDTDLILVSQTRGVINYMISGKLNFGTWGVRIPKKDFFTGINQISILNPQGEPLLERLFFYQADNQVELTVNKTGDLGKRNKINLDVQATYLGEPVSGNFSVSIADASQMENSYLYNDNLVSNLLMSSDIAGSIYQPGYYFKDREPETLEALDLVMMTNGWTRFTWKDVMEAKFPSSEKFIERGINIEGTVKDVDKTRKGLKGGKISAIIGDGLEIVSSEFGPNGRFIFLEMDYPDTVPITITAEDGRQGKNVDIVVDQNMPLFANVIPKHPSKIMIPQNLLASYQERNLMKQMLEEENIMDLEGVTVEGQTLEKEEASIKKIYGAGDATLKPENIISSDAFTNIFQLIQGRVAGVQVFISGQSVNVTIRGVGSLSSGTQPLYLLDNMPVDAGTMLMISPRDVATVDVFKDPAKTAIFGSQGSNGVIAVYTKTGMNSYNPNVPGKLMTRYKGYNTNKEFYHPKYEGNNRNTALNDKRTTLYWNPALKVNGNSSMSYYNSDVAKKHLVIIEGMDQNGRLARYESIIE